MKTAIVPPGHHLISYAYPSSDTARKWGFATSGCYVSQVGGVSAPHITYAAALKSAQHLGTVPARWSMDHPANAHFLRETV